MSGRLPRHVLPGKLHEVTFRCHQARPLLRPSEKLNELLIGCLAMARRATGIEIVWLTAMSNHAHALVVPETHTQLSDFLCHCLRAFGSPRLRLVGRRTLAKVARG